MARAVKTRADVEAVIGDAALVGVKARVDAVKSASSVLLLTRGDLKLSDSDCDKSLLEAKSLDVIDGLLVPRVELARVWPAKGPGRREGD